MEGSSTTVLQTVAGNSKDFLGLVTDIGSTCMQNEVCMAFLTVTFLSLAVRLFKKVVRALGRGR
ncbi:MAG: hypothetical protein J1F28_00510 [Oscillospiraceae bacterium]|nr:hypothetical protein [Oscillospiraceae bacterium]